MLLKKLEDKGLIHPPRWLTANCHYLVKMGSEAYATMVENSDSDIMGWAIPPRDILFPHTAGIIKGFGYQGQEFNQYQQHHINDIESRKQYDITIFNLVKIFELARLGNPNIIDMLFAPQTCILVMTTIAGIVRENRHLFLSKRCWPRYKGYAYAQLKHLDNKNPIGKRAETVAKYSYDTKYASHIFRLLGFIEQIMLTKDLNIQQDNEQLKAIRRGEWTEQEVKNRFYEKEKLLEKVYLESDLPDQCDEKKLKEILLQCLEAHYGSLANVISSENSAVIALRDIDKILSEVRGGILN